VGAPAGSYAHGIRNELPFLCMSIPNDREMGGASVATKRSGLPGGPSNLQCVRRKRAQWPTGRATALDLDVRHTPLFARVAASRCQRWQLVAPSVGTSHGMRNELPFFCMSVPNDWKMGALSFSRRAERSRPNPPPTTQLVLKMIKQGLRHIVCILRSRSARLEGYLTQWRRTALL
jgi:hypothetical protein